jgi:hypothetical protein
MEKKTPRGKGQRAKTDWDAVHRDYRTGVLTDTELAAKYTIDRSTIAKKAKREAWVRDLGDAIRAETDAKLAASLVASETTRNHAETTDVIAAAAEVNTQVILRHRSDISEARELTLQLLRELSAVSSSQQEIVEIHAILTSADDSDEEVSAAAVEAARIKLHDLLKLHNRVGSMQKLADTLTKLQALERKAFKLDDEGKGAGGIEGFLDGIAALSS